MASFQSLNSHFRRRLARLGFSRLPYPPLAICRCILMIETGQRAGLANRSPAASNCKTLRATKWRLSVGAGCPRAKTGFGCNKRHTKSGRARWGEKRSLWGRNGPAVACRPRGHSASSSSSRSTMHALCALGRYRRRTGLLGASRSGGFPGTHGRACNHLALREVFYLCSHDRPPGR